MTENITIQLANKKYAGRILRMNIQSPENMVNFKVKLLSFFAQDVRSNISGFKLVRPGPPDDYDDDISEDYFNDIYNDNDAVTIFNRIKSIYQDNNNQIPIIYFRAIKSE